MTFLLDTHAWLWMMLAPERVGPETQRLISDPSHTFRLSIASVWEIAIKHALGRLTLPADPLAYIQSRTTRDGVTLLPIELEHACNAAALPRHHADPFDRLLIAQATAEKLTFITADAHAAKYAIAVHDPRS